MKRSLFSQHFKQTLLAVPAAALMLGAAQAGTTVGLNFQAWYYDSGTTPQTVGYGRGYQTTGFPVTAKAFGVDVANWSNTDPLDCQSAISTSVPFGGTLTAQLAAPNAWQSGIGELNAGFVPEVITPGNDEVTWGYLDSGPSQSPSVFISGLAAKFPNGYVIQTIAAEDGVVGYNNVDITDGVTTNTVTYSTYYIANAVNDGYDLGGTVGVSSGSGRFTSDTININCELQTAGNRSTLAGFIITDQPIIGQDPVGITNASGTAFVLSANVIGLTNGLHYQWRQNGNALSGANSATYTNLSATTGDSGDYDLVVTNLYGIATSGTATIKILPSISWVWAGNINSTWDIGGTANWKTNGVVTTYLDGISVQFDDSAVATTVNNAVPVSPFSMNVTNNTKSYTIGGSPIAGSTSLTKNGANSLTLTGINAFTGNITLNSGMLSVGGDGQLGGGEYTGAISDNGNFTYNSTADQTLSGVISGSGILAMNGSGTLTLSANEPITGGITVNSGTLRVTTSNFGTQFTPSLVTINTNGILLGDHTHALGFNTSIFINQGIWELNYEDYKTNITMIDGQINTGNGGNGGELRLGYFGTSVVTVTNSMVGSVINEAMNTYSGNNIFNVYRGAAASDLTINSAITSGSGSGGIIKSGNGILTLTGANAYLGPTFVNGGTLALTDSGDLSAGAVTVSTNATLLGTGLIYGPTTIQAGGTLTVGSSAPASINIYGALDLQTGSSTILKIDKTGGNLTSDAVQGLPSVTYGGTLTVQNVTSDGTILAAGDVFQLFPFSSYTGGFDQYILPALPAGLSWDTSQLLVDGSITVSDGVAPPTFSPAGGSYTSAQTVTISSLTAGAIIYYTTDGTTPTTSSANGTTPVTVIVPVNTNMTITVYAVLAGHADSSMQSATYVTVETPTWVAPYGGSWSTSANWSNNVVPNGIGSTADFSELTLQGDTSVSLDIPITIGSLIFADEGNAYNWLLTDGGVGPLTLNAGANIPTISILNTNTTISAVLAGTTGLAKTGAGTLTLSSINTYTGGTIVNAGTLVLAGNSGSSGTINGALTVNPGASVIASVDNALGYSGNWLRILNLNGGILTTISSGDNGWGLTVNMMGGTLATNGSTSHFAAGGGWTINTLATNIPSVISGDVRLRENNPNNQLVFNVASGTASPDLLVSSTISGAGYGIVKAGTGVMLLNGPNTYTGATVVSNGIFEMDGSLSTTTVTINSGATLRGTGIFAGAVAVSGVLTPSVNGLGMMTISNSLTLGAGSTTTLAIDRTTGTANFGNLQGITAASFGGTLTVTNLGGTFQSGDIFKLFSANSYAGNFAAMNLPTLGSGLGWTWSPTAGTLAVGPSSVNTNPTNIMASVSGSVLTLTWPSDHTGWRLLEQTNHLDAGLSSNTNDWGTVSGSASTNQEVITVDPTRRSAFYRLVYP